LAYGKTHVVLKAYWLHVKQKRVRKTRHRIQKTPTSISRRVFQSLGFPQKRENLYQIIINKLHVRNATPLANSPTVDTKAEWGLHAKTVNPTSDVLMNQHAKRKTRSCQIESMSVHSI